MGFVVEVINHLRLAWRLFWDERVTWWQRVPLLLSALYFITPLRYDVSPDVLPLFGMLDDWLFLLLCTYVFVAVCPPAVVREHRLAVNLSSPVVAARTAALAEIEGRADVPALVRLEAYRHPREPLAMALGGTLLLGLTVLGGVVVVVGLFVLAVLSAIVAMFRNWLLLRRAIRVGEKQMPYVQSCLDRCFESLPAVPVKVYVLPSGRPFVRTFGLDRPQTLVLSSYLVEKADPDALVAIIGHELGHILFDHTFFSSLLGGVLYGSWWSNWPWSMIFGQWRRAADLSADRVSLLACGDPDAVLRALVVVNAVGQTDQGEYVLASSFLASRARALIEFDADLLTQSVERWLTAGDE